METPRVTILFTDGSFCTDIVNAQRIVNALEARAQSVEVNALVPNSDTLATVVADLSKFVRFIEHGEHLRNVALEHWRASERKVLELAAYR